MAAKLWFFYGAMGSSKTADALMKQYNYHEKGMKAALLKPKLENRDGEKLSVLELACKVNVNMWKISLNL